MATELIPIRLSVTAGDLFTMWAPFWRADNNEEWEAFLGRDFELFAFESVADLAAFVRNNTDHDLGDHPEWESLTKANAHQLKPDEDHEIDLVGVPELLAEKPTKDSIKTLAEALSLVSSFGAACELPDVRRFFNGNPSLGLLAGGIDHFTGRSGRKRWTALGAIIDRNWESVIAAIDGTITVPEVDAQASQLAAKELDEPYEPEPEPTVADSDDDDGETESGDDTDEDSDDELATTIAVPGSHEDFWAHVGIDPVRIMIGPETQYTLRCYFDERPIFLGRNGRISVFPSGRAMVRYLADEHDHDLSDLSTYDDIHTAATDGSLRALVSEDNVYVLRGLADDIAEGPDGVDRDQLALAVEFVRDVGLYAGDDTVEKLLGSEEALGKLVNHVLDPDFTKRPGAPYAAAVRGWEELERFVESRLRHE